MSNGNLAGFRQDFPGNQFLVEKNVTEQCTRELVVEYESHEHHHHYWECEIPDSKIDFSAMLRGFLNSGGSLDTSLKVLRNPNASAIQCTGAVSEVRNIDLAESKRVVLNSPTFSQQLECLDSMIDQIESDLTDEK